MMGTSAAAAGPTIASVARQAYLRSVVARLLVRLFVMLALITAPLSMVGGGMAMAMPAVAGSHHQQSTDQPSHCAEKTTNTTEDSGGSPMSDCAKDCALACSAIPALGSAVTDQVVAPSPEQPAALVNALGSLFAEAADPPPRTA